MIIDVTVIANKIDIKAKLIDNCFEFQSRFSQRINLNASKIYQVRFIFDQYGKKSLKEYKSRSKQIDCASLSYSH